MDPACSSLQNLFSPAVIRDDCETAGALLGTMIGKLLTRTWLGKCTSAVLDSASASGSSFGPAEILISNDTNILGMRLPPFTNKKKPLDTQFRVYILYPMLANTDMTRLHSRSGPAKSFAGRGSATALLVLLREGSFSSAIAHRTHYLSLVAHKPRWPSCASTR